MRPAGNVMTIPDASDSPVPAISLALLLKAAMLGLGLPFAGVGCGWLLARSLGASWFSEALGVSAGAALWGVLLYYLPPRWPVPVRLFLARQLLVFAVMFFVLVLLFYFDTGPARLLWFI
jgi:hypothetical protein